jgi:transcriptional regulator with XRE-family HTH domain
MHAQKAGRRRGVILSPQGQHKLSMARGQSEEKHNFGDRYTYEDLCGRTGLSLNTIIKILQAETPVDRQSLDQFFSTFGLTLEREDYTRPTESEESTENQIDLSLSSPPPAAAPLSHSASFNWGEAPDVSLFYGQQAELDQLAPGSKLVCVNAEDPYLVH